MSVAQHFGPFSFFFFPLSLNMEPIYDLMRYPGYVEMHHPFFFLAIIYETCIDVLLSLIQLC